MRGDLELEGDAVRAMWFRNLLSDRRWWIKTWRRLQPLLVSRQRLNPGWIAKHYDSTTAALRTDRESGPTPQDLRGRRRQSRGGDAAQVRLRLRAAPPAARWRGARRRPRLGRVPAVLPRPRRARARDHAVAAPASLRREADRRARPRRAGAVPRLLHPSAGPALHCHFADGGDRRPLRLPAGARPPGGAAGTGRARLPRLRRFEGAGGHLQLHHQVCVAGRFPPGLHAGADGRRRPLAAGAGRRLGRPPQLPPVGEEGAPALAGEPRRGAPPVGRDHLAAVPAAPRRHRRVDERAHLPWVRLPHGPRAAADRKTF